MGAKQPFGAEGMFPGGILHLSQDGIMLQALKNKKKIEVWRQIQNNFSEFRLAFQEAIILLCPKQSLCCLC